MSKVILFHTDKDVRIAERAMSSIAIGRKNWLFSGSKAGGERAAAIYSVIETCKLNGIEPQAYIANVIAKIADDWPASRWDELIPWNWQTEQNSKSSRLNRVLQNTLTGSAR